ncbi:MAG: YcxB family protein [Firmicutes bacterium]|nr:YcxB family protein [Bacillota bacterium]
MEEQHNEQAIVEITKHAEYGTYRRFYWFSERFRPTAWFPWLLIAFGPVYWVIMYGPEWVRKYHEENIVELSFLLFFVPFITLVIVHCTTPRRLFNRYKKSYPMITTNAFFEAQFTYNIASQNRSDSGYVGYENVNRAYETKDAFYLRYNDKNWNYYPKKFLAPGQAEALRALFARKFGEKFKMK